MTPATLRLESLLPLHTIGGLKLRLAMQNSHDIPGKVSAFVSVPVSLCYKLAILHIT